jgi:hypothetical protein
MDDIKGFFASKTVWAGLAAIVIGGAPLLGWTISEDDARALTELAPQIGTVLTGLLGIYGRVTATKRIG